MQLLRSITIDSTPNVTEYFKFAFITVLQAIKTVLLCYPINVALFAALTLYLINRVASIFQGKKKFEAVYEPRPHQENSLEEVKLLKKEIRAVQADLIELLRQSRPLEENQGEEIRPVRLQEDNAGINEFFSSIKDKSRELEEIEGELKKTVVQAFEQISKLNES